MWWSLKKIIGKQVTCILPSDDKISATGDELTNSTKPTLKENPTR